MEQAREASQKPNVFAGMRKIAALSPVSAPGSPPPGDSVNAPIAMYCRHYGGWTGCSDPRSDARDSWRVGNAG
jgi:hypothetical protein